MSLLLLKMMFLTVRYVAYPGPVNKLDYFDFNYDSIPKLKIYTC